MTIRQEDQLNDAWDEAFFQIRGERVLVELQVQGCSELVKEGLGHRGKTQAKDLIIRVVVTAGG